VTAVASSYQASLFAVFAILCPLSSVYHLFNKENWWKWVYCAACQAIDLLTALGLRTVCVCVCVINRVKYIGEGFCVAASLRNIQCLLCGI
jgi:hypothetical protein